MSHPAPTSLAPPDYDGHFVMIPLSQGKFALVDEADAEMVLGMGKWHAQKRRRLFYASGRRDGRPVAMHVVIAGFGRPDHINRNGLDNRRINLRAATPSQNNANIGLSRQNKSGYKGVSWDEERRKWMAVIGVGGHVRHLGRFGDPLEAARAYNAAALEVYGEFAWLNPVPTPCGTGWSASGGVPNVPTAPRGITGVVFRTLVTLGGEATTSEICEGTARGDSPLSGLKVRTKLDRLATRGVPLVEEIERGGQGRGRSSRWRLTPEGRAIVAGSQSCGIGWPQAS